MENNPKYHVELPDEWRKPQAFTVPQGYFEQFPDRVLQAVNYTGQTKVPDGYFEAFPQKLLEKIRQNEWRQEMAAIAPGIANFPKAMPFAVPDNYFDEFRPSISTEQKSAPIFSLRRVAKWAAAACLAALLGWSVYFLALEPQSNARSGEITNSLEALPDEAFEDLVQSTDASGTNPLYVAIGWKAPEEALENFSVDDLKKYLENSGINNLYDN